MSKKKVKYFKWISSYSQPDFNAIVRETDTEWENVTYSGMISASRKTVETLNDNTWYPYWKEIKWPEFRKLKSELLKGKKGN